MDKNEALDNFLVTFKISLTTASVYFREHPLFLKAVKDLKDSIENLLNFLNPIKIGIGVDSLFIDNKNFEKSIVYQELASIFHRRKTKYIKITKGINQEEIASLLLNASLSAKELIRKGGLKNALIKENCLHIEIGELDYSLLLRQTGAQNKEIWTYLLEEAIEGEGLEKINQFADNFEGLITKINPNDFLKDEELKQSMQTFLGYLKEKEEERFKKCSKQILKSILKDKDISSEKDLKEMNVFIKGLNENDLADSLWDEILNDDNFDALSFNLFFKLVDEKKHKQIQSLIIDKHNKGQIKLDQAIKKKIRDLFSLPGGALFETIYKHAFDFLLKDISLEEKGFVFNRDNLLVNYRFMLLNLFSFEPEKDKLNLIKEKIFSQWDKIIEEEDFEYLKYLLSLILEKTKQCPDLKEIINEIEEKLTNTIENFALSKDTIPDFSYFLDNMTLLTFNSNFYLTKIFKENKVNPLVLELFFKFYTESFPIFCDRLKKIGPDIEFSINMINNIKKIDLPYTLETLKTIFSFSNNFVRIEILKVMQDLLTFDKELTINIIKNEDMLLKKEALLILKKHNVLTNEILDLLFILKNPFGRKNNILIENMLLVDDLGLKEAKPYLINFSKKRFFWNTKLRKKALFLLNKWNVN